MVVPESLISSAQYRFAVQYLQNECRIRIVAGMPEALFKTSGKGGTHTKTCLLVFDKKKQRSEEQSCKVFFAEAKIDPYLLLAILGSEVVQSQIRSKRVTHDIIDSLGARINELLLPIPKNARKRHRVSTMVKKVVNERVEARELARRAREMVAMA